MPSDSTNFLDTNILVYEWDPLDSNKQRIARKLIAELGSRATISSQVIQEFAWVAQRKLRFNPTQTERMVASYDCLRFVPVESNLVRRALLTSHESQLSFWDALIIEAAVVASCKTLYTEDLNHGRVIRGLRIVNPFL